MQLDSENGEDTEGNLVVCLSKEEKARIRAVWKKALIIKAFGRKVGYNYLYLKLRSLWNLCGKMDCIDLGSDYFLIKFDLAEDVDRVLKGGPWFIGQQFLAIRQWEPEFRASEDTFSSVAVWIRLPELPIEYYDPAILRRIGQAIGPVLRIDAHTACGIRGGFGRLCIQVNLDKPLEKSLTIGKRNQAILYKGINSLCFSCGRIGHRKEGCPYTIKEVHMETPPCQEEPPIPQRENNEANNKVDNISNDYGEWMVVARRKPTNRYKASIQTQSVSQESETSQGHIGKKTFKGVELSKKDGKRKVPSQASSGLQRTADKTARPFPRKDGVMSDSLKVKVREKSIKQRHWVQSQKNEVGPSFVGPNFSFGVSQFDECAAGPSPTPLIFSSPASSPFKGSLLKPNTRLVTQGIHNNGGHEHVGDFLPRQSHSDWGGNDQMDQTGSDGDMGLVRLGANDSLEESVPAH